MGGGRMNDDTHNNMKLLCEGSQARTSTCSVIPFRWSSRTGKEAVVYKSESVCQWCWRLIGLGRRNPKWRHVLHVNQHRATLSVLNITALHHGCPISVEPSTQSSREKDKTCLFFSHPTVAVNWYAGSQNQCDGALNSPSVLFQVHCFSVDNWQATLNILLPSSRLQEEMGASEFGQKGTWNKLMIYLFWPITEINYKHVLGAGILGAQDTSAFSTSTSGAWPQRACSLI